MTAAAETEACFVNTTEARLFLETLYMGLNGLVAIGIGFGPHLDEKGAYKHKCFQESFFGWPEQIDQILSTAEKYGPTADVYVCPLLRDRHSREKGTGTSGFFAWADVDEPNGREPQLLGPSSLVVDSGNGLHPYIYLGRNDLPAEQIEQLNRRIALLLDADSGWSETKYLRLPGTWNHKGAARGGAPLPVRLVDPVDRLGDDLNLLELDALLPPVPNDSAATDGEPIEPPEPKRVADPIVKLLNEEPISGQRSEQAHRLIGLCVDYLLADAQILALALRHRPTVDKYGSRAATEIIRSIKKIRADRASTGANGAKANGAGDAPFTLQPIASVEMKSIKWFKKPLWQIGFHLLAARKGSGKGVFITSLAIEVLEMGMSVVWFSGGEDSVQTDIKPRLVAAGMDHDEQNLYTPDGRRLRLPEDVDHLREQLRVVHALRPIGLIVFDPLGGFTGKAKTNSDEEVRAAITPLNALADEFDCVVAGARNVTVKKIEHGALAGVLGSSSWVDVPRAVIVLAKDDEDPHIRHAQCVAGNRRSGDEPAVMFRVDGVDVDGLDEPLPVAVPIGESTKSIDDLLMKQPPGRGGTKSKDALMLILDILDEEGEQESDALDARVAQALNLSAGTVQNLRADLGPKGVGLIRYRKSYGGGLIERWYVSRSGAPRQGKFALDLDHEKNDGSSSYVLETSRVDGLVENTLDPSLPGGKPDPLDPSISGRQGLDLVDAAGEPPPGVTKSAQLPLVAYCPLHGETTIDRMRAGITFLKCGCQQ